MARTPDRHPGDVIIADDGVALSPQAVPPTVNGEIRYVTGQGFRFYQEGTNIGLGGGSGVTEATHQALETLTHNIAETSFDEIVYSGTKIIRSTTWQTSAMLLKIREEIITYVGSKVDQVVTTQYDNAGVALNTLTETYNYTGTKITSIDRVYT